jgi:dienelactone hydrolase
MANSRGNSLPLPVIVMERAVEIAAGPAKLQGDLSLPPNARGVVLFAHGSGSSRHSRRNKFVASGLHQRGLATLLMDLLTEEEERVDEITREWRFDIELLTRRLGAAIDWLGQEPDTRNLRIGLFGASTGGGAALAAAAQSPEKVGAVVSRGGRPDLAGEMLPLVQAPVLLIVGSLDTVVVDLNAQAAKQLRCEHTLQLVSGATHLFEEPGTLEEVTRLAGEWFTRHLGG